MLERRRTRLQAGKALDSSTTPGQSPGPHSPEELLHTDPLAKGGLELRPLQPSTALTHPTHLVEFPEVLFLSLVNDGKDTGDGFANNSATKMKDISEDGEDTRSPPKHLVQSMTQIS